MSSAADADKSSTEITSLTRYLSSTSSKQKDKIRRLARFKTFAQKGAEFYDDDVPTLLLGEDYNEHEQEGATNNANIGLLQACGIELTKNQKVSKTALLSMQLLKYLVVDFVEPEGSSDSDALNIITESFMELDLREYAFMKLDLHLLHDGEGNSKSQNVQYRSCVCELVAFILVHYGHGHHPLSLEEILCSNKKAQGVFIQWLGSGDKGAKKIKAKVELAMVQNASKQEEHNTDAAVIENNVIMQQHQQVGEEHNTNTNTNTRAVSATGATATLVTDSLLSPVSPGTKQKIIGLERKLSNLGVHAEPGVIAANLANAPTRWDDSPLVGKLDFNAEQRQGRDSLKQEEEELKILIMKEEARQRELMRDPLSLREENFDLRYTQANKAKTLEDVAASVTKSYDYLSPSDKELVAKSFVSLEAREASLVAANLRKAGKADGEEKLVDTDASFLLTDPSFDSLLFLTYAHGKTSHDRLKKGMTLLAEKKDDQLEQQIETTRSNFPLFARCSNGIDIFGELEGQDETSVKVDRLEERINETVRTAKISFKPLLDNTSEVRKTKTALSMLNRVAPFLAIPSQMKQHIDAGRFGAAIKAYRRVMAVDDDCSIDLLRSVKRKATEAASEARTTLENILSDPNIPVTRLLDSIRDLDILITLNVKSKQTESTHTAAFQNMRNTMKEALPKSPALACLVMQSSHFSTAITKAINESEATISRIAKERMHSGKNRVLINETLKKADEAIKLMARNAQSGEGTTIEQDELEDQQSQFDENAWRMKMLDARITAVLQATKLAKTWLPRLVRLGVSTRESEVMMTLSHKKVEETAFKSFVEIVAPAMFNLVQHAVFCALGQHDSRKKLVMSVGKNLNTVAQTLLRTPLSANLNETCAAELVELSKVVQDSYVSASIMCPDPEENRGNTDLETDMVMLERCTALTNEAVVTAERRLVRHCFESCANKCSANASSKGVLDIDLLHSNVVGLATTLSQPAASKFEVEAGCRQVVLKSCMSLNSYASDRDYEAKLKVVTECARAIGGKIQQVVRELVDLIGGQVEDIEELLLDDIRSTEERYFDEYLTGIRTTMNRCVKIGWVCEDLEEYVYNEQNDSVHPQAIFPGYLSTSLLSIIRFRAQVLKALNDTMRKAVGESYQMITVKTAAAECLKGMCNEINSKMSIIREIQAEELALELDFLVKLLDPYLFDYQLEDMISDQKEALHSKSGRTFQEDPDGLHYTEQLEKLGRVYVLCLDSNV